MREFPEIEQMPTVTSTELNLPFTVCIDKQKCLLIIYSAFVILGLYRDHPRTFDLSDCKIHRCAVYGFYFCYTENKSECFNYRNNDI